MFLLDFNWLSLTENVNEILPGPKRLKLTNSATGNTACHFVSKKSVKNCFRTCEMNIPLKNFVIREPSPLLVLLHRI